jgi:hypothetical protein
MAMGTAVAGGKSRAYLGPAWHRSHGACRSTLTSALSPWEKASPAPSPYWRRAATSPARASAATSSGARLLVSI